MDKKTNEKSNKKETGYITLFDASKETGYAPEHLNLLCRKGKLKGEKIGRNWFVKREWLDNFILENKTNKKGGGVRVARIQEKIKKAVLEKKETSLLGMKKNDLEKTLALSNMIWEKVNHASQQQEVSGAKEKMPIRWRMLFDFSMGLAFFLLTVFPSISYLDKDFELSNLDLKKAQSNVAGIFSGDDNDEIFSNRKIFEGVKLAQGPASAKVLGEEIRKITPGIDILAEVASGDGIKISDGEYEVRFSLYNMNRFEIDPYPSDSDKSIWSETQTINVKDGTIDTRLGVVKNFPQNLDPGNNEYYLGVRIGKNSEMVPRKKINVSPLSLYAYSAQNSQNARNAQTLGGAVTGTAQGNIPIISTGGKIDIGILPTGASGKKLVLANDARLNQKIKISGGSYITASKLKLTLNQIDLTSDVTGILPVANGGTGLASAGTANQILGMNSGATGMEYKTLTAGANVTITHSAGGITISSSAGGGVLPSGSTGQTLYNNAGTWTATSNLYHDGTNVGIGTTDPSEKLEVNGNIFLIGGTLKTDRWLQSDTNVFIGVGSASDGNLTHTSGNEGWKNTAIGNNALKAITTGYFNTAIGADALYSNTEGNVNSAMGAGALYSNTTGTYNSAVGASALSSNTTGYANSALGAGALSFNTTGAYNSALGLYALIFNTTGNYNSAVGSGSLSNNNGDNNSAMGYYALFSNVSGYENSAMGSVALVSNTTGYSNSAMGFNTLYSNNSGHNNVAMGANALYYNTSGYYNSAVGVYAGAYIANGSSANATSNNSIYLGYNTKALANGDTNEIVIGSSATGNGSNSVTLGNTSITKTILQGNVGIGTTNPTYNLQVAGTLGIGGTATFSGLNVDNGETTGVLINASNQLVYREFGSNAFTSTAYLDYSGTNTNYVPYFSDADTLTKSSIYYDGTNVGIGTTSPTYKLDVNGTTRISDHLELISDIDFYNNRGFLTLGSVSTDNAKFRSAADIELVADGGDILMTGNVGIGTTNPTYNLQVAGTLGIGGTAYFAGNVGIGTTGPATTFHIVDSGGEAFRLEGAGTSGFMYFSEGTNARGYIGYGDAGTVLNNAIANSFSVRAVHGLHLAASADAVNGITIQTTGNVGIGTTGPSFRLDVKNSGTSTYAIRAIRSSASQTLAGIWEESDGSASFYMTNGSNIGSVALMTNGNSYINGNGNVGIGTTVPYGKLDVNGATFTTTYSSVHGVRFHDSSYGVNIGGMDSGGVGVIQGTNFGIGDANIVMQMNGGNVGIGTTNPTQKLFVYGTGGGAAGIMLNDATPSSTTTTIYNSGGNLYWGTTNLTGGGALPSGATGQTLYNNAGTWTANYNLYHDGTNVGIGTSTPAAKLDVSGTAWLRGAAGGTAGLFIDSSGNVGIGTTSPSYLFHASRTQTSTSAPYNAYLYFPNDASGALSDNLAIVMTGGLINNTAKTITTSSAVDIYQGIAGDNTTVTNSRGLYVQSWIAYSMSTVSMSNMLGVEIQNKIGSGTGITVGNSYGIKIDSPSFGAGTVSYNYGLYIQDQNNTGAGTLSNTFNLYSDGTNTKNYFAGNVGIGTTAPDSMLHIYKASGSVYARMASGSKWTAYGVDGTGGYIQSDNTSPFSIYTNNTERLKIDTSGNVGIGTTNPTMRLHVVESTVDTTAALFDLSSTDSNRGIVLRNTDLTANSIMGYRFNFLDNAGTTESGGSLLAGKEQLWTSTASTRDSYLSFSPVLDGATTEALRITSGGNVGIGTTAPSQKLTLDNNGNLAIRITKSAYADNFDFGIETHDSYINYTAGTSTDSNMYLRTNGNNVLVLTDDGNVGIGTINPGSSLEVYKSQNAQTLVKVNNPTAGTGALSYYQSSSDAATAYFGTGSSLYSTTDNLADASYLIAASDSSGGLVISSRAAAPIKFYTNGAETNERMRITSDGNIGIGTTNPIAKLQVIDSATSGNLVISAEHTTTSTSGAGAPFRLVRTSTGDMSDGFGPMINFLVSDTGATNQTLGWVGFVRNGADNSGMFSVSPYLAGAIQTSKFVVNSSGNVGIGTTNPVSKLDVYNGNLNLTDSDVFHGMTTNLPDNSFGSFSAYSGTAGGLNIVGASDTDAIGMVLQGFIGSDDPTDTVPAVAFSGSKKNGTTVQALGNSETVFQFKNYTTNLVTILGSGNVGIGTTGPEATFHISTSGNGIRITDSGDADNLRARLYHSDGNGAFLELKDDNENQSVLIRSYALSGVGAFINSGNVGIGTTGPAYKLEVNGDIGFTNVAGSAQTNRIYVGSSGTSGDSIIFTNSGNAADLVTIKDGGNVGIGTTSPGYKLDIETVTADGYSGLQLKANNSSTYYGYIIEGGIRSGFGAEMKISQNNNSTITERIRINYLGYVGIGTTNPTSRLSFGTAGDTISMDTTDGADTKYLLIGGGGTASITRGANIRFYGNESAGETGNLSLYGGDVGGNINFTTYSTGKFIFNTGNVGIGTTNPDTLLTILDSNFQQLSIKGSLSTRSGGMTIKNDSDKYGGMYYVGSAYSTADYQNDLLVTNYNGDDIQFGTGFFNPKMIIKNGGNVGIGTTNPGYKLDIYEASNNGLRIQSGDAISDVAFSVGSAAAADKFIIQSGGNVGIGTTAPSAKLHVAGDVYVDSAYEIIASKIGTEDYFNSDFTIDVENTYDILFQDEGTTNMIIDGTNGNVGIGTTNPTYKLQVAGTLSIGSTAYFASRVGVGTTAPAYAIDAGGGSSGYDIRGYDVYTHDGGVSNFSDARLKNINGTFSRGLNEIAALNPIYYQYKKDNILGLDSRYENVGLVAQDLQKLIPEAVKTGPDGFLTMTQGPIFYTMINAIKELSLETSEQQGQISNLQFSISNQIQNYNDQISKLSNQNISIDEKIQIIGESLNEISNNEIQISNQIQNQNDQINELSSTLNTLQDQMDLIKQQNQAVIDFAKVFDPETLVYKDSLGNVDLGMGKLEAEGIVAGAFSVKVVDESKKTLGEAQILAVKKDEDADGIDDETMSDGKSVAVKTKAVSSTAKIFITSEADAGGNIWVEKTTKDGNYVGFRIYTSEPVKKDIKINWFIVEEK